jgi:hypothetical protein
MRCASHHFAVFLLLRAGGKVCHRAESQEGPKFFDAGSSSEKALMPVLSIDCETR